MDRGLDCRRWLRFALAAWVSIALVVGCQKDRGTPAAMQLSKRYQALKNAGDSAADALLVPMPTVPAKPVSPEEAERIQTECFLHQDIRILSIRADSPHRLVLTTKGNVSAPTLQVQTAKGVDRVQRTMANPDLIVEVRGGRIHGVRAEMHSGR